MKLHFLGVRGSTPTSGTEFDRVGGHTSCVAVTPSGHDRPTVVLDAGTGLQRLGPLLDGEAFRGTLLLTHLHWDHTHGLPFCPSLDRDDARVRVVVPAADDVPATGRGAGIDGRDAAAVMARAMSPPHFPIGPDELLGDWTWDAVDPGPTEVEGCEVEVFEVPHKGGRTFGYRLTDGTGSVAYLPDHLPAEDGPDPTLVARLRDVDLLLHDAQFTSAEQDLARRFGHATVDEAVAIARSAGVGRLILFHHAPGRTDDEVDRIEAVAACSAGDLTVTAAREGEEIDVAPATVGSCPAPS